MKKLAVLSVAAVLAAPALAAAQTPAPVAGSPAMTAPAPATTSTTTTTSGMPAAPIAAPVTASKKVELKDGSWAEVASDGSVSVSKDAGKTWTPAPDGTLTAKDGSTITTKGGKKL